jgi:hypothetical protein
MDKTVRFIILPQDADLACLQLFTKLEGLCKLFDPRVEFHDDSFSHEHGIEKTYHWEFVQDEELSIVVDLSHINIEKEKFCETIKNEFHFYKAIPHDLSEYKKTIVPLKLQIALTYSIQGDTATFTLKWEERNATVTN